MNRNEKKVIFLNNVKSEYIEQAILVLKDKKGMASQGTEQSIILEAERIVQNYSEAYFGHSESRRQVESVAKETVQTIQIAPSSDKQKGKKLPVFVVSAVAGIFVLAAAFAIFLFL
jgi:hypothetical protein